MEKIATRLTDWLIAKEAVSIDEKELYEYGIFHLLLNIINTISILLLALLFDEVISTVFYIICFCTLRRYAGGYHAKTVFTCYLLTLTAALGMIVLLRQFDFIAPVQFALWFISDIIILLFAPIQNENKILDDIERIVYQKRAIITWLIQTIGMVLLYRLEFSNCFEAILISHMYVAISMLVGKIISCSSIERKKKMKSKKTKTTISLLAILCLAVLFATIVSAYSSRGYFSSYVGYGNLPDYSSYLYKIETGRQWFVVCTSNPSTSKTKYEIVNSNGESRGSGKTSNSTFTLTPLTCSGKAGYKYRLKVTKMSSHPLKAYYIEADWDTDVN